MIRYSTFRGSESHVIVIDCVGLIGWRELLLLRRIDGGLIGLVVVRCTIVHHGRCIGGRVGSCGHWWRCTATHRIVSSCLRCKSTLLAWWYIVAHGLRGCRHGWVGRHGHSGVGLSDRCGVAWLWPKVVGERRARAWLWGRHCLRRGYCLRSIRTLIQSLRCCSGLSGGHCWGRARAQLIVADLPCGITLDFVFHLVQVVLVINAVAQCISEQT